VSHNIEWGGELKLNETLGHYYAFKNTDRLRETECKYVTMNTDLKVTDYVDNEGYTGFSLYDFEDQNIARVIISDNESNDGTKEQIFYFLDGESVLLKNDSDISHFQELQIRLNLVNDVYDVYFNETQIANNLRLPIRNMNAEDVYGFGIDNVNGRVTSDFVDIYCSDVNGNPLLFIDEDALPVTDDFRDRKGDLICNLFLDEKINCTQDSECQTGLCAPDGTCSRFDFTYCDEKGYGRGNKCLFAGVISCGLTSTGNLILDNFWLFLVFLLIMMFIVYIVIIFRGSKN